MMAGSERCRKILSVIFGVTLLFGAAVAYRLARRTSQAASLDNLTTEIRTVMAEVQQLRQEQAPPAVVLDRYRNSIGYICGVYDVGYSDKLPEIRMRIAGTGFLVGDGLVATNRHVAEPWYGDSKAKGLIENGATATLESLVVFFPSSPKPIRLLPGSVSKTSDLAVLRTEDSDVIRGLAVLPLAISTGHPGQFVTVMGYPLGTLGMVVKSPSGTYERLAYPQNDIHTASKLASMSLVRPSTTYGHLGDVIGDKVIYDAPSAHGGSGGPVLDSKGEVIAVNTAYVDGFSGGTIGLSVEPLRRLVNEAQALSKRLHKDKH
jgi:S1-C subfamily serine protease